MIKKLQVVVNDKYDDHRMILDAIDTRAYNTSEQLRSLILDGIKFRQGEGKHQAQVQQPQAKPIIKKPKGMMA